MLTNIEPLRADVASRHRDEPYLVCGEGTFSFGQIEVRRSIRFVKDCPQTSTGKILRRELRMLDPVDRAGASAQDKYEV